MAIQQIKIEVADGYTSDYCSLRDEDGIEFGVLRLDKNKVQKILVELKWLSIKIRATTYASLLYLDFVSFEFDKEPEYHRVDSIKLSSDGIITVESSSKYDPEDCFEATFEI